MARLLQVRRGSKTNLPTLSQGEFGFCTDSGAEALYIGSGAENIQLPRRDEVVAKDELQAATDAALAQAKASGEFDGEKGDAGADGVSVTHAWSGTTLTVTSASGTSSADLKGEKGDTGATGAKGDTGATGATGAQGPAGADGYTPVKGTDYCTEADKAELVEAVIAALPDASEVSY